MPNHLGDVVGHPRVDGGAPLDVGAVVGLLVDAEGGADDDCRRDDPLVDGIVERFLNLCALHRAVGLARVAMEKLDDRVGLAVGGGVVAWGDDEDGQGDPAGGAGPGGLEHAVLGLCEGRVECGRGGRLRLDVGLAAGLGGRPKDG